MNAQTDFPTAKVLSKRNRTNRIGLYIGIVLCVALLVGNILQLVNASTMTWHAIFAFPPLVIAFLLFRQLPKYSDKTIG